LEEELQVLGEEVDLVVEDLLHPLNVLVVRVRRVLKIATKQLAEDLGRAERLLREEPPRRLVENALGWLEGIDVEPGDLLAVDGEAELELLRRLHRLLSEALDRSRRAGDVVQEYVVLELLLKVFVAVLNVREPLESNPQLDYAL
jgi:hypothetical protein